MRFLLVFFINLAFAATSLATDGPASASASLSTKPEVNTYLICRNGKMVRTLRIDIKDNACSAYYTKEGKESLVAKSGTNDKCIEVVNQIRETLEKSVWKCKEVEPDRVSFTLE